MRGLDLAGSIRLEAPTERVETAERAGIRRPDDRNNPTPIGLALPSELLSLRDPDQTARPTGSRGLSGPFAAGVLSIAMLGSAGLMLNSAPMPPIGGSVSKADTAPDANPAPVNPRLAPPSPAATRDLPTTPVAATRQAQLNRPAGPPPGGRPRKANRRPLPRTSPREPQRGTANGGTDRASLTITPKGRPGPRREVATSEVRHSFTERKPTGTSRVQAGTVTNDCGPGWFTRQSDAQRAVVGLPGSEAMPNTVALAGDEHCWPSGHQDGAVGRVMSPAASERRARPWLFTGSGRLERGAGAISGRADQLSDAGRR